MFKVEKFKKEDYDALLDFFDENFERRGEMSFVNFLPPMWHRDDLTLGKNFGIKKDGKIVAAMGVYPLKVNISGEKLKFATTGNIAVDSQYRNMGLMRQMMEFAFDELEKQNIDCARLGGDRSRYIRYGYDYLGQSYSYILTSKNLTSLKNSQKYIFTEVKSDDNKALDFIKKLIASKPFYIDRGNNENVFKVMTEFYGKLYLAKGKSDEFVGAISVSADKKQIFDFCAENGKTEFDIICSYLRNFNIDSVCFSSPIWNIELNRKAGNICEKTSVDYATQCKILNWEKLINASIKLKNSLKRVLKGNIVIEIEKYGKIEICEAWCKRSNKQPDISLDHSTAKRLIFGILPPINVCDIPEEKKDFVNSIFPLPFWWNCLDKV